MNSRLANVLAVTAVGVVWFAGCSDDGASTEPAASSTATATTTTAAAVGTSGSPQWLYVMDATDGSGGDGAFTLRGVNPSVISFTDRPARVARRIAIEELVSSWADVGFSDDPPNASLVFERDGREHIQTVTLTNPRLEGDELTFSYSPLTDAAPVVVVGERTAELPAQFGTAALFIDASRSTVGASIGVGDAGAYIQFTPDVYDCPGNSDDDCWGVLLGQDMEPYAPGRCSTWVSRARSSRARRTSTATSTYLKST